MYPDNDLDRIEEEPPRLIYHLSARDMARRDAEHGATMAVLIFLGVFLAGIALRLVDLLVAWGWGR